MLIKCLNGSLISSLKSSNDFCVIFSFPFLFQPCCLLLLLLYCNPGLFFFFSYFFLTIFISLPPPRFLYNNTYYYTHMLVSVLYFFLSSSPSFCLLHDSLDPFRVSCLAITWNYMQSIFISFTILSIAINPSPRSKY